MTASVLKQNPNTKRFKRTLIYFIKKISVRLNLFLLGSVYMQVHDRISRHVPVLKIIRLKVNEGRSHRVPV